MKIKAGGRQPKATKVFVVTGEYVWESGTDVLGVCSSRLLAQTAVQALKALPKSRGLYDKYVISESTLDRVSL
jgi:hypothetical protein